MPSPSGNIGPGRLVWAPEGVHILLYHERAPLLYVRVSAPGIKPGIATWLLKGVGIQTRAYQELDDVHATTLPS